MYRVGLTGGIASGKSTVCQYFADLGITIFDADLIARELTEVGQACYHAIVDTFGHDFLLSDQQLNRTKLRKKIFSDSVAKRRLEAILHPAIKTTLMARSEQSDGPYCLLVIPLLCETDSDYSLNRIAVVDATAQQQLTRLCQRDDISNNLAQAMLNQQCQRQDRLALADDIIHNDSDQNNLASQIANLHKQYLQFANAC